METPTEVPGATHSAREHQTAVQASSAGMASVAPEQIKKREYTGLAALLGGVISVAVGAVLLLLSQAISLIFLGIGAACALTGIVVLNKIPPYEPSATHQSH